jgi:hypothetical protein
MSRLSKVISILFFLGCLLILFIPVKDSFNYYDEGLVVLNADRISAGDIPYEDFWTVYPPGQFYVVAAVFKLFGKTLFAARV